MKSFILIKNQIFTIILFFLIFSVKCTSTGKIETEIVPQDTYQTHIINTKCASIMSNDFAISAQEIKPGQISLLLKNRDFIGKNICYNSVRFPKLMLFLISFENAGEIPFNITGTKLTYNNSTINSLDPETLKKMYKTLPYSALNFDEILSLFKLDSDEICDPNIDFTAKMEKYNEPIKPGDKIFQIIAFDWLPIENRKFTISVYIKSDIIKKIIDFKLMRSEYRHSGEYFIKPLEEENNF